MSKADIRLEQVFRNPFADYPQLRTIFDGERSRHVEADTIADLALGPTHDPHRNRVFVARNAAGEVVGVTGFFQPHPEPTTKRDTVALRWHGVVPQYRGYGYSEAMFEQVCGLVENYIPEARSFIELVPLADQEKAGRIIRHFEKLGFHREGEPQDAKAFPVGAALPEESGLWQTMRGEIKRLMGVDGPVYRRPEDFRATVV